MKLTTEQAYRREYELEADMIGFGVKRYRDRLLKSQEKGTESTNPAGQRLLRAALRPVVEGIERFVTEAYSSKKAGRRAASARLLRELEHETVAFLAIKATLDALTRERPLQGVALEIGNLIDDELRFRSLEENNGRIWRYLKRVMRESPSNDYKHHRDTAVIVSNYAKVDTGQRWTQAEKLHLGQKLVEIIATETGLVQVVPSRTRGKDRTYAVVATEKTLEWLKTFHARSEVLSPVFMPMVVPPVPWSSPFKGGYCFTPKVRTRLVKTRNRNYLEELKHHDMPVVYGAVNRLQETAWRINKPILRILREAYETDAQIPGMPATELQPLPTKPADIAENEEARKAWRKAAAQVHARNRKLTSKATQFAKTLWIAEKYEQDEAIYFPYALDFRGRAYPIPMFLQPQGSDYAKALLTFSEGKRLGNQGAAWLAVHLANCYGEVDKAPLEDRIKWVQDHEEDIYKSAMDPLGHLWWARLDKPGHRERWQTLAACFEWVGYMLEGEEYISHLPVAMDGSCNGLQHYSAMLRDEVGGKAVNLTSSERPADIYQMVIDRTIVQVEADARSGDPEIAPVARRWLDSGLLDRGMSKRPVMTLPYGAQKFGMRNQIVEELKKRSHPFEHDGFYEAKYLAERVWDAIGGTVIAARSGMDWLQTAARLAASEGLPIHWMAPNGLPVLQEYKESTLKRIKTQMFGKVLYVGLQEDSEKLDRRRQQNGIAPNFVHSLDASAMMLTVCAAAEEGITAFSMVHDSYATHAADAGLLADCLREEFVRMYEENDVLEDFRETLVSQLTEEHVEALPPLPEPGDLDLSAVLESDFFFA